MEDQRYLHDPTLRGQELARAIWTTVLALVREQDSVRARWRRNLQYYLGDHLSSHEVEGSTFGLLDLSTLSGNPLVSGGDLEGILDSSTQYNVCRMIADALIARITLRQAWPTYQARGASEELAVKAQEYDRFLRRELRGWKMHQHARARLRLCTIFGTAFAKIWGDRNGEKVTGRAYGPDRVVFDDRAARLGQLPPSVFHVDMMDKSELLAMFPGSGGRNSSARAAIERAPVKHSIEGIRHSIEVVQYYRTRTDDSPGRMTISTASDLLLDAPFDRERHLFTPQTYGPPLDGLLGSSLIDEIVGIQREIDYMDRKIRKNLRNHSDIYIERQPGSFVQPADLERDEDEEFESARVIPPGSKLVLQDFQPAQLLQLRESKKAEAFEVSGLNLLAVTATKPAGLDSGEAQRVFNETQTQRFSEIENQHSEAIVVDGELTVEAGRNLATEGRYPEENRVLLEALQAGHVEGEDFALSVAPSSSLPQDPAGQVAALRGMMKDSLLTRDEARAQVTFLDLDKTNELDSAPRNTIESICEKLLSGTKRDIEPQPMMDLLEAQRIGRQYWNRAFDRGVNQERLDALEEFVVEAGRLMRSLEADEAPPTPEVSGGLPADTQGAQQLATAQAALGGGQ